MILMLYSCTIATTLAQSEIQNGKNYWYIISLFSTAAYDAVSGSYFGHGDLPMLLGYAGCNGREPQLANCSGIRFNRPISQTCDNTRVAGVRCLGTYDAQNRIPI